MKAKRKPTPAAAAPPAEPTVQDLFFDKGLGFTVTYEDREANTGTVVEGVILYNALRELCSPFEATENGFKEPEFCHLPAPQTGKLTQRRTLIIPDNMTDEQVRLLASYMMPLT